MGVLASSQQHTQHTQHNDMYDAVMAIAPKTALTPNSRDCCGMCCDLY